MTTADATQLHMLQDRFEKTVLRIDEKLDSLATSAQVEALGKELVEVKLHLVEMNGQVGRNAEDITVLDQRATTLEDRVGDTQRMRLLESARDQRTAGIAKRVAVVYGVAVVIAALGIGSLLLVWLL